jgi:hypothetical protein
MTKGEKWKKRKEEENNKMEVIAVYAVVLAENNGHPDLSRLSIHLRHSVTLLE